MGYIFQAVCIQKGSKNSHLDFLVDFLVDSFKYFKELLFKVEEIQYYFL